jgi:hypothetical protein
MDMLASKLGKNEPALDAMMEMPKQTEAPQSTDDLLMVLAGMLEPDGGMPGKTEEIRIANSTAALVFFVAQGNTQNSGPFRVHVDKLLRFLNSDRLQKLNAADLKLINSLLQAIAKGHAPKGNWESHASKIAKQQEVDRKAFWQDISAPVA